MKIYCDGIFDLFHLGHYKHFKSIKKLYPNSILYVGIIPDKIAIDYKRKPIWNEKARAKMVFSCKYVDHILLNAPLILDNDFIIKNSFDLVVHAFNNPSDIAKQSEFFKAAIKLNKFKAIPYHNDTSTSEIIKKWNYVKQQQLPNIDIPKHILELNIKYNYKLLEIGTDLGVIGNYLRNKCDYYGVDNNLDIINNNIYLTKNTIYHCSDNSLPFKDKYFDIILIQKDFIEKKEIERISKESSSVINKCS